MYAGKGVGDCSEEEGGMLAICVYIYICTLSHTYSEEVIILEKEVAIFRMCTLSHTLTWMK